MFFSANGNALDIFKKWYVFINNNKKTVQKYRNRNAFYICCSLGIIRVNGLKSIFLYLFIYLNVNK